MMEIKNNLNKGENGGEDGITPEMLSDIKAHLKLTTGLGFDQALKTYQELEKNQNLTETDLASKIVEVGGIQAPEDSSFIDLVRIGARALHLI